MDAAGIDEVSEDVETGVKVGDRVMAMVCPASTTRRISRTNRPGSARGRPCTGRDHACRSLYFADERPDGTAVLDLLELKPGQVLAVTGAAGAYGGYVIQLAKTEGLTVIADAAEKDRSLVESLAADIVVARGDDVADRSENTFPMASTASPTARS